MMSVDIKSGLDLLERKKEAKRIKKARQNVTDLLGAKSETPMVFLASKEEALLRCVYEVLMPQAMRTGRNEILIASNETEEIKTILKSAGRLGLSVKEVEVDEEGKLDALTLGNAITKRSLACMISWAEPLSGVIHPAHELSKICKEDGIFFMVDASECLGKVYFRWQSSEIDMMIATKEGLTMVVSQKPDQMQKDKWGKDFDLDAFYKFASWAGAVQDQMDMEMMKASRIKNDVMERLGNSLLECQFLNRGASFLPDRWYFAFDKVPSEILSYFLCSKGIESEFDANGVSLRSSGDEEEALALWDEVIKSAKEVRSISW